MRRSGGILLALSLSAVVFLLFLGRRDIVTSHEARVAQTAREMAATGWPWAARPVQVQPVVLHHRQGMVRLEPDLEAPAIAVNAWAVPLLKGEIRLQKPPLPYWCAAILFRLFGFSEAAARFVPALMGALCTLLLYDLTRLLAGRRRAVLAALIWSTSYVIPDEFRMAMADPYLAFFTLLCIWAWVRGCHEKAEAGWLVPLVYLSVAMGLLAKGPPLLIHLVIALGAFHFCCRRRAPGSLIAHCIGWMLLVAVVAPWPLYVLRHVPNAIELWRYESVGELSDNVENARPWWFYLPNLLVIALPWIAAELTGIFVLLRHKRLRLPSLFPLLWMGGTVFFFSFVNLKKNPYLLPVLPAQAMLIAEGLNAALAGARRPARMPWGGAILVAQTVIGIGLALLLLVLVVGRTSHPASSLALLAVALLAACCPLAALWLHRPERWLPLQSAAYVLMTLGFFISLEAPLDNARSAKSLARELEQRSKQPGTQLLYGRLPEEVAIYLPIEPQYGLARHLLIVLDDQVNVRRRKSRGGDAPTPEAESFASWIPAGQILLVTRVPMDSAPGDARWKVYELTVERRSYARR